MDKAKDSEKAQGKIVISEMTDRSDPKPYDAGNYRIINKETITIYSPNVLSKKKRIISV